MLSISNPSITGCLCSLHELSTVMIVTSAFFSLIITVFG